MPESGSMRIFIFSLFLALSHVSIQANSSAFLSASFWDDGAAEVSVYTAQRYHYGRFYPAKIKYFLVKESFSQSKMVKADNNNSQDAIPVIKLNQVISTPTGTYDYQQMHSSFWSKDSGSLLKFSMSHHEACGSSYKQGLLAADSFRIQGNTYWEGQSVIQHTVPVHDSLWFYDELPFRLRQLLADKNAIPNHLQIIPSTIHSKAGSFQPAPARAEINGFTVTVDHAHGKDVLQFDPEWPHVMTSWQQADGESLTLEKTLRIDYWNHHAPGDEKLLK